MPTFRPGATTLFGEEFDVSDRAKANPSHSNEDFAG